MENENTSSGGNYIDIRYNLFYSISMVVVTIIMIVLLFTMKEKDILEFVFIVVAFLFLMMGTYALSGRKYVRMDKQNKKVIVYGFFGLPAWKYKYDRLFFKNDELYREIDGKIKFINILRSQCRKEDYEVFVNEINKEV